MSNPDDNGLLQKDGSVKYAGFPLGMDNRRSSTELPPQSLRNAVNVDILDSGKPRTRHGASQAIAEAGAHSAWATEDETRMLWGTASTLRMCTANLTPFTLLSDPRLADPLSFVEVNGDIYFSNESINGKVTLANQYEPWGITPPAAAPTLTADVTGDKLVQVTCAFVTATGELSGAPLANVVACTCEPQITATGIPQSTDPRVVATALFVSDLDGTQLYRYADVPAGSTTAVIRRDLDLGEVLTSQFMQPPPPGQLLEYYNGSVYIAIGSFVVRTTPLRYGMYDPEEDFLMYPARVTLLQAHDDGIYASADQTYFEASPFTDAHRRVPTLPYRAVEGAALHLPESSDVVWLSERGFIQGGAGGAVKNLTEERLAVSRYERATLGIFEHDGHKAIVAIARAEGLANRLVAADYNDAEAARLVELE